MNAVPITCCLSASSGKNIPNSIPNMMPRMTRVFVVANLLILFIIQVLYNIFMKKEILNNSYEMLEFFVEQNDVKQIEFRASMELLESMGYKAFVDIAQIYRYRMLTPKEASEGFVELSFAKLDESSSFHKEKNSQEKYGIESEFFHINKLAQPSFLYYYQEALKFCDVVSKKSILNLGINKGDEFEVIQKMLGDDALKRLRFVGVDHSASIINYAQMKYPDAQMLQGDINELDALGLGRFELIISIGTLQSSNINFNERFMSIYQNQLQKNGAIILGFPNCRWIDGEMLYGAVAPNYSFPEMSLVLKDIHFCKKYLQQKGYRVVITGKDYLFLSARKIGK